MTITSHRATTPTGSPQALRAPGFGKLGSLQGGVSPDGRRWTATQTSFDPDEQVADTIPKIRAYVQADSQHPYIEALAQGAPGTTAAEKAWHSAKQHLEFMTDQDVARLAGVDTGDEVIEVLQRPIDVAMQYRMTGEKVKGDCDDFVMFATAIAKAYDPSCDPRYVCVAAEPKEPGVLSHIYCTIDGVPCDASHGLYPGWEVPQSAISRRVEYSLSTDIALWTLAASVAWFVFGPTILRRLHV